MTIEELKKDGIIVADMPIPDYSRFSEEQLSIARSEFECFVSEMLK